MEGIFKKLQDMEFDTIEELYERREEIREKYKQLDYDTEGKLFKWYFFYQVCCIDYDFKSAMWDYICEIGGSDVRVEHQYKLFKNKKEKYHQKYLLEEQKKKEI